MQFTDKTVLVSGGSRGIGLAIVKNSIDSLGGSITYETEKNQGTKFIIQLNKQKWI